MDSPELGLDRKRVVVLLQINAYLLHACLTTQNKADYVKRLHCNLACLASINDVHTSLATSGQHKPLIQPVILAPPADCPELVGLYRQLNQLYPGAMQQYQRKVEKQQMQAQAQAQAQAQSQTQSQPQSQIHTPTSFYQPQGSVPPPAELSPEQILARASQYGG